MTEESFEGKRVRWPRLSIFLTFGFLGVPWVAPADELTQRYLTALRERQLDGLLERYCLREIQDATDGSAPALSVELAFSFAKRASENADATIRRDYWQSADTVLKQAIHQSSDPIIQKMLALERGKIAYAEGEWLRQQDELEGKVDEAPSAMPRLVAAVEQLRGLLASIELDLGKAQPARTQGAAAARIDELMRGGRLWLGRSELALARSLPAETPERSHHLTQAMESFLVIANDMEDAQTAAIASLALAETFRRMNKIDSARGVLDQMPTESLTQTQADRVLSERVELFLAENQVLQALELLHDNRSKRLDPPAEWEYLYLKVLLRQASAMQSDPMAVGKLQASALRQLRTLDDLPDRLWIRRGELLLRQHAPLLLLRDTSEYKEAAEILARSGDHAQAAGVYRQASQKALDRGDADSALGLLFESARSFEWAGQFHNARDTFAKIASTWPQHPTAGDALLRAALAARKRYLMDQRPESYRELNRLVEELAKRPADEPTTSEGRYLRGTLRKAERRYEEAVEEFFAVPEDHPLHAASRLAASRAWEAWKRPLQREAAHDGTLGQIIAAHESFLTSEVTERLGPAEQAEMHVRWAKFLLDARVDRPADAQANLTSLMARPELPHEWIQQARRYLILALVRQSKFADAERLAREHAACAPEEILATLNLLAQETEGASELEQSFLGRVERKLVSSVKESVKENADNQGNWAIALARIELHEGNESSLDETSRQLEKLRQKRPRDARLLELLAECYARGGRYEAAIRSWRALVDGLAKSSPDWYHAKLNLIASLRRNGQTKDALEVMRTLEVLHPDLGGTKLRQRFLSEKKLLTSSEADSL